MALGLSPGRSRRGVGDGERLRGSPRGARGRLRQDHPDATAEIFPLVRSLLGQREGHGHGTPATGPGDAPAATDTARPQSWAGVRLLGAGTRGTLTPGSPMAEQVINIQPVIKAGALPVVKAGEEAAQVGGTGGRWPYSAPPNLPPPFTAAPWHSLPIPIGPGQGQGRTFHPRRHLQPGCGGVTQPPQTPKTPKSQ